MGSVTPIRPSGADAVESEHAGDLEVTTGWMQDEGEPETRTSTVVVLVSSEDGVRQLVRHLTPADADRLSVTLSAAANRARRR